MKKTRVLVVDDEPETVKYVGANLQARGYEVRAAGDGSEALRLVEQTVPDLILLDLSMPGPDGFEVCRAVRAWADVPIIILTARGQEKDKVRALDLGADDYLTKPFGVEEMLARVRAVLRRSSAREAAPRPPFVLDDLQVDFARRRVTVRGQEVKLTPTEYGLLQQLVVNAGKVLTHAALLRAVWGPEYHHESDYLWAYVRRLRRKIEPDPASPRYLLTEPGVGYRFRAPE